MLKGSLCGFEKGRAIAQFISGVARMNQKARFVILYLSTTTSQGSVVALLPNFKQVLSGLGWAATLIIEDCGASTQMCTLRVLRFEKRVLRLETEFTVLYMWFDVPRC